MYCVEQEIPTAIQDSEDRVIVAEGSYRSLMNNFCYSMGVDKMISLPVEKVVDVEHDLGQKPIICLVQRGVNKVTARIRFDC